MEILHNSQELFYRSPFGAVATDEVITIRIKIGKYLNLKSIVLRLWKNNNEEKVEMHKINDVNDNVIYEAQITSGLNPGLLWYYFIIEDLEKTYFYGNNKDNLGEIGEVYDIPPDSYQITVYKRDFETPNWFKNSVMYQIFVDRFYNGSEEVKSKNLRVDCTIHESWDEIPYYKPDASTGKYLANDFFGGNLKGIIKKLPYLKDLGINVIYLNPIFKAFSNHKYDTGDYSKIDPMFGDNDDFISLCTAAEESGISIILDGVFSHTGSDSVYFNQKGKYPSIGAFQSKNSLYYRWYNFIDYPNKYECWWGIDTLPNVNEMEPTYQDFIINDNDSIAKRWLKAGARGWRLDVVDELPGEFLKNFRKAVKETKPDAIIIGEVWEDASHKISYGKMREYLLGEEVDSVMNYPLRYFIINFLLGSWNAEYLNKRIMSIFENYPIQCLYSLMNLIGSHDVIRIKTLFSDCPPEDTLSKDEKSSYKFSYKQQLGTLRLKIASLFQMTFTGVPCIYYGDEAGLEGYGDPFNRRTYPWGKEDKELIHWYKKIIRLRNSMKALRTGRFIPIYFKDDVYAFLRVIDNGKDVFGEKSNNGFAAIFINRSKEKLHTIEIDVSRWGIDKVYEVLDNSREIKIVEGALETTLLPLQGKVFTGERVEIDD